MKKSLIALLAIIALASFLRLYKLPLVPPGLYPDEAMNGNNALEALHTGHFQVFYPENNGREGLFMNVQALFLKFFGIREPWVLRLPSALFGILTVLGTFFLGRELFDERIGLLASFFTATNFWHINFSRIGFRAITAPFFLVWSTFLLVYAFKERRKGNKNALWLFALAGIMYGLGFYSYIAYRTTPLLIALIVGYYLWHDFKRGEFKKSLIGTVTFSVVGIVVILPLLYYFASHAGSFLGRTSQVSIFANVPQDLPCDPRNLSFFGSRPLGPPPPPSLHTPLTYFACNTFLAVNMFFFKGDGNWRHNVAGRPELFWPVAILLLIGTLIAFSKMWKRFRRFTSARRARRYAIGKPPAPQPRTATSFPLFVIFTWIILALLPVALSNEGVPHALRSILLIPPVMLLAALGGAALFDFLSDRAGLYALRVAAYVFVIVLIFEAYHTYFVLWARDPNVPGAFATDYVTLGRILESLPKEVPKYVVVRAGGVTVRDNIPMPAQTTMFITDTFLPKGQKAKNIYYLLPQDESKIPTGSLKFYLQ